MPSPFKIMKSQWQRYSDRDINIFLSAYFTILLARMALEFGRLAKEVRYETIFNPLSSLVPHLPDPATHQLILLLTLCSLAACLWPKARPFALLFALPALLWIFTVHESIYSPLLTHRFFHARIAVVYPLVAFLGCDWVKIVKRRFGRPITWLDRVSPLLLTQWVLGLVYLGPTLQRILTYGYPGWYDGTTLQSIFLARWISFGGDQALYLAQHFWVCWILQQLVLLLEGAFFLCALFPKLSPVMLLGGFSFHFFGELLMKVSYADFTLVLYSVFFQPRFLRDLLGWCRACLRLVGFGVDLDK